MTLPRLSALGRLLALLVVAVSLSPVAQGGETWDGNGGDNDWTTNNNWNPNGDPPNDGTANIVMAGTNRLAPVVDVDWDIFSLTFNNTAGAFSISGAPGVTLGIAGGGISNQDTQTQTLLAPINLNASQTWSASAGPLSIENTVTGHPFIALPLSLSGTNNIQISGAITSGVAINKTGSGTLTFDGFHTNAYTGATTVAAGTLVLDRDGRLGANFAIPGNLIIGDGSGSDTVRLDSSDQISEAVGKTVTVNSSGLFNLNGFSETIQNLTLNGGTVSGGTLTVNGTITTGASTTSVISSALPGVVTVNGAGALTLSGTLPLANGLPNPNSTTIINGGTVLLNKSGGAFAVQDTVIGDGSGSDVLRVMAPNQFWQLQQLGFYDYSTTTIKSSGLLDLNGFAATLLGPTLEGGSITTGAGTLSVGGTLRVLPSPQPATIIGNIEFIATSIGEFPVRRIAVSDGAAVDDLVIDGSIGSFIKDGPGQMRLIGNSPPTSISVAEGTLVLAKGGVDSSMGGNAEVGTEGPAALRLAANEQILASPGFQNNNAVSIRAASTFDLAGFNETINDLKLVSTGAVNTGGGTLAARNLILQGSTLNPASGLVTLSGTVSALGFNTTALLGGNVDFAASDKAVNIQDGIVATDLEIALALGGTSLTITGSGTLLLSGPANTYAGPTTVSNVVLDLGKSAADGAVLGDLTLNSAAVRLKASEQIAPGGAITLNSSTIDLNGFVETIGSLSLNGAVVSTGAGTLVVTGSVTQSALGSASIHGHLDLGGVMRTVTSDDSAAALDLDIPAQVVNGGIIKQGGGTWRLGGNSTFAGGVDHQIGKLLIAHDNALGTGTLTLGSGTTIEPDSAPRTISNPVVVTSLSTIGGSNDLTLVGPLTMNLASALFKSNTGALTIAGPQSHAPGATLSATAGTVNFNSSATGGTLGVNLSNAGTLVNFNADQELNTLVVNGGRVSVGDATRFGASSLSLGAAAVLELQIGGLIAGDEFAQLMLSGNVALAGALEITLTNGFSPTVGNSFDILDWGSLSGTFSSLNLPALGGAAAWDTSQLYTTGELSVVNAIAYSADFDEDGEVDGDDLVKWRGDFGVNALSDADDDGDSDGDDFLTWQRQLGGGVPATLANAAVPEPAPLALISLAGCGLALVLQQRR